MAQDTIGSFFPVKNEFLCIFQLIHIWDHLNKIFELQNIRGMTYDIIQIKDSKWKLTKKNN